MNQSPNKLPPDPAFPKVAVQLLLEEGGRPAPEQQLVASATEEREHFLGDIINLVPRTAIEMPTQLAATVSKLDVPPLSIVAAILVMYIILGGVMDELSMILLTIPVLFPAVMGLDLGLPPTEKAVWFGILVLGVVQIGLIAPPVGLNVYVVNGIVREVPMAETYRGVLPFLVADMTRIVLMLIFPALSLTLVRVMT